MKCSLQMSDKTKEVVKIVCKVVSYIITLVLGALGGTAI